jgi:siroheme synthase-like protein
MIFLPIAINISSKKILLVGGGKVAKEKLIALQKYTSEITIISEIFNSEIQVLPFITIQKSYEKDDLKGYFLVYACTNNRETNVQIKKDCESMGILACIADTRDLCDFISPAILKRDNLSVAVSSNGEDVRQSLKVRSLISKMFENGIPG